MFKGVVPGPQMLAPESQGGQLTLVFSLVWLMVVANLITVAICFLGLNRLARLTALRAPLLVPCTLVLICLGAFAETGAREDLLLLVAIGAVGCAMVRLDWPRAPLLLGLVLGPLAENRGFLSVTVYGFGWLTRPGVLLIAALIAMSLAVPVRRLGAWRAGRLGNADESDRASEQGRHQPNMPSFRYEALFSVSIAIALAAALWHTHEFSPRAALFPRLILVPTLALSLYEIGRLFSDRASVGWNPVQFKAGNNAGREGALVFAWFSGFVCAIWFFGFVVAVPFWMFLYLLLASRERWDFALAVSASVFLFVYLVMPRTPHVAFPDGVLLGLWL